MARREARRGAEPNRKTIQPKKKKSKETFGDRFRRGDLFGWFDAQARFFPQEAGNPLGIPQSNDYWFNGSLAWEPGFFMNVTDYMNFELILFGRVDQHDRNRTHGDIREGFFELFFNEWTLGFGIHKVFWGVTESRHLVDIINQTDLVEDFDTDIKLGQAMVTTSYTQRQSGHLQPLRDELGAAAGVPGAAGTPHPSRYRSTTTCASTTRRWKAGPDRRGLSLVALHGRLRLGLELLLRDRARSAALSDDERAGLPVLQPVYELIHQGGLDVQYTVEGWLLKAESIVRGGQGPTFGAVTGGFEYTFYQASGSIVDIGLILEYNYDSRNNNTFIIFENDFFTGVRLSLSDVGSTEFLVGSFIDAKDGSVFIAAEASRRFGDSWKILLEGRGYIPQKDNVLQFFRNDAQIQVDIEYHY